jgi:hypothetical protein
MERSPCIWPRLLFLLVIASNKEQPRPDTRPRLFIWQELPKLAHFFVALHDMSVAVHEVRSPYLSLGRLELHPIYEALESNVL